MVHAGQYKVIIAVTKNNTDAFLFTTTFGYLIRGATPPPLAALNTFEAGKHYVVAIDPQINGAPALTHNIFGINNAAVFAGY